MIREPYIGMPITIGTMPGCIPGRPGPSGPSGGPSSSQNPSARPPQAPDSSAPSVSAPSYMLSGSGFDRQLLGNLPVAMTYTPMQQWTEIYPAATALKRGTVFPVLDLPFEGITAMTGRKQSVRKGGMQP